MRRACPTACTSKYLRRLFLRQRPRRRALPCERTTYGAQPISACRSSPSATETDHVAPWRSVYKIHLITDTEVTFVLTRGGHNAGIVSEPGHEGRHYRISYRAADAPYVDPKTWYAQTQIEEGSWWPAWLSWLDRQSPGRTLRPSLGAPGKGYRPLEDAPGMYVLER